MATTPNYGWVTPAPSNFVTNLPADFETFADAVDADLAGLLGGTTGQILTKDSNTDHDFSWQTPSGVVPIPISTIDAKGDLVAGTAADTVARLAVGANGTVLTADSGETTGLKWVAPAGSKTVIASGSIGVVADFTISSIPSTYKDLQLIIRNFRPQTDGRLIQAQFNGTTTSSYLTSNIGTSVTNSSFGSTQFDLTNEQDNGAGTTALLVWDIPDYANATTWKISTKYWLGNNETNIANPNIRSQHHMFGSTSAISSIKFFLNAGNFTSGDYILYGIN